MPQNYRPVSLTSVVCKIMEGIIRDHIIEHMKINKMFSDKQFGLISGRSTTLQLLNVLTIWSEILDEGGTIGIPQGSVLGPLLFVIYINDMPDVIDRDSFLYLFADDT